MESFSTSGLSKALLNSTFLIALTACGGSGGGGGDTSNKSPTAINVSISDTNGGTTLVGDVLTGSYDYVDTESDVEGESTVRWLRNGAPISGAMSMSYITVVDDDSQTITFEVTPVALTGTLDGDPSTSSGISVGQTDSQNPIVAFAFPSMSVSYHDESSITVRGTASDNNAISSVAVNGTNASSSDSFANWTTNVSLSPGANIITVVATDLAGNVNSGTVSITVEKISEFTRLDYIAYDSTSSGVLVHDNQMRALLAFDLVNPLASVISSSVIPDNNNSFSFLKALDVDPTSNRVFVADNLSLDRLLNVDLATGTRNVITQDTIATPLHTLVEPHQIAIDAINNMAYVLDARPSGGSRSIRSFDLDTGEANLFTSSLTWPNGIAVDNANNRLLVTDSFNRNVFAFDLATANRTVLTSNGIPDSVNTTTDPIGMALDSANNRAFILEARGTAELLSVNLTTGARTLIATDTSNLLNINVFQPVYMTTDGANNRVFIADGSSAVYAVNLTNGVISVFSDNTTPDVNNPFSGVNGLTLDAANNRLLATSINNDSVSAVSLTNGARTILSNTGIPDSLNPLDISRGIAIDTANNRALIVDDGGKSIIAVNLTGGARTIFSDSALPDANNTFDQISSIAYDATNDRLLVTDRNRKAIIGVDVMTGARAVVSDAYTPDQNNQFTKPVDIVAQGNQAWVLDDSLKSIFEVNITTGARTILSSNSVPDSNNNFTTPRKLVLDGANSRLLVMNGGATTAAITAVDTSNGTRSILSDNTTPDEVNPFIGPLDITLEAANDRALVLDPEIRRVMSVNLITGARTPVAGGIPDSSLPLFRPKDIAIDTANNRALIFNGAVFAGSLKYGGVLAIDLTTGARSVFSDNTTPDAVNPFSSDPRGVIIDSANSRALILTSSVLYSADLSTGARTVVASGIGAAYQMALDSTNNRVLITDVSSDVIRQVDLTSGLVTALSDNTTPDATNPLDSPRAIVIDSANNRAIIGNSGVGNAVLAVDLNTGARTLISDDSTPNANNALNNPGYMILDSANNRALIADSSRVIGVDLTSGERSIYSNGSLDLFGIAPGPTANQLYLVDWEKGILLLDMISREYVILSQ